MIPKHIQIALSRDAWEVLPDELNVFEDFPLGKGCYGEVYKGILMGRRHRFGSKRGVRSPRYSLTNTVAVKRLQGECLSVGYRGRGTCAG